MKLIPLLMPESGAPLTPEHRSEWINESNSLIPGSDEFAAGHRDEKKEGRAEAESIPDIGLYRPQRTRGNRGGRRTYTKRQVPLELYALVTDALNAMHPTE